MIADYTGYNFLPGNTKVNKGKLFYFILFWPPGFVHSLRKKCCMFKMFCHPVIKVNGILCSSSCLTINLSPVLVCLCYFSIVFSFAPGSCLTLTLLSVSSDFHVSIAVIKLIVFT